MLAQGTCMATGMWQLGRPDQAGVATGATVVSAGVALVCGQLYSCPGQGTRRTAIAAVRVSSTHLSMAQHVVQTTGVGCCVVPSGTDKHLLPGCTCTAYAVGLVCVVSAWQLPALLQQHCCFAWPLCWITVLPEGLLAGLLVFQRRSVSRCDKLGASGGPGCGCWLVHAYIWARYNSKSGGTVGQHWWHCAPWQPMTTRHICRTGQVVFSFCVVRRRWYLAAAGHYMSTNVGGQSVAQPWHAVHGNDHLTCTAKLTLTRRVHRYSKYVGAVSRVVSIPLLPHPDPTIGCRH
jgi:hypothetical protein